MAKRPTDEQIRAAVTSFRAYVDKDPTLAFKIGRCADDGKGALAHREMYKDVLAGPTTIWKGTADHVEWLEKALIGAVWSHEKYRGRCRNEQLGGGGKGGAETHHLYVCLWAMDDKMALEIALKNFERAVFSMPDE